MFLHVLKKMGVVCPYAEATAANVTPCMCSHQTIYMFYVFDLCIQLGETQC